MTGVAEVVPGRTCWALCARGGQTLCQLQAAQLALGVLRQPSSVAGAVCLGWEWGLGEKQEGEAS